MMEFEKFYAHYPDKAQGKSEKLPGKVGKARGCITDNHWFRELCESCPAVTRLTVYCRPK